MKRKGNPIGWRDTTWNPVVGCSKISPGCEHCYAETMAIRLAGMGIEKYQKVTGQLYSGKNGWNHKCYLSESELEKPLRWKQHRRIFVSSMGDLFHENVPFEWIDRVMAVIALNPQHTFMILTKRAERMAEYFSSINAFDNFYEWFCEKIIPYGSNYKEIEALPVERPLPNLHIGVTAENQETADLRIPILLKIPAALRFVSIEPMLGPVDLREYLACDRCGNYGVVPEWICAPDPELTADDCPKCGGASSTHENHLDWVILGMETGPGARTFPGVAEAIVNVKDQCVAAGVPFFYKGPHNVGTYIDEPGANLYRYTNESRKQYKIDGIEYRQFPEAK